MNAQNKQTAHNDQHNKAISTHETYPDNRSASLLSADGLREDQAIQPANLSYRNHFKDFYSSSSMLKSIGKEDECFAVANPRIHQTIDAGVSRDERTPGLGGSDLIQTGSNSNRIEKSTSGKANDRIVAD